MCVAEGQDPYDPQAEIDPDKECGFFERSNIQILAPCKDNCRGRGKFNLTNAKNLNVQFSFSGFPSCLWWGCISC